MDNQLAFLLGIVQGLTEFFPVSSSGHLLLLESFFKVEESLFFNVICHLGTLGSIITVFYKDLLSLNRKTFYLILAATFPLVPCVLLLKEIRNALTQVEYLPYFFASTALLLFLAERKQQSIPNVSQTLDFGPSLSPGVERSELASVSNTSKALIAPTAFASLQLNNQSLRGVEYNPITLKSSILIGIGQTVALFPGISRSGTTIACARMLGWSREEAIRFSFLIAIPAILGAVSLESYQTYRQGSTLELLPALIGLFTSYLFGLIALLLLKRMAQKANFKIFAWYCLGISVFVYILTIR